MEKTIELIKVYAEAYSPRCALANAQLRLCLTSEISIDEISCCVCIMDWSHSVKSTIKQLVKDYDNKTD